jgi:plastocyanin
MLRSVKVLLRLSPVLSAILLGSCGYGGPAHVSALPGPGGEVTMGFMTFNPAILYVRVGDTVKWRNTAIITHTVTDDPKLAATAGDAALPAGAPAIDSGDIAAGDVFSYTFHTAGTYKYFCKIHERMGMVATVVVEP